MPPLVLLGRVGLAVLLEEGVLADVLGRVLLALGLPRGLAPRGIGVVGPRHDLHDPVQLGVVALQVELVHLVDIGATRKQRQKH